MPAIPTSNTAGHKGLSERADFALSRLQEESDIEFKQSATWETLQEKIIKTCLAMANLPRGGIIIIGVAQDNDGWCVSGVGDTDMATFDPDEVMAKVNSFASPAVRLTLVRHPYSGRSDMLVLEVQPFDAIPVVCKKNGPDKSGLKAGTVFIRPLGKAESRAVMSAEEMHDMLDRSVEHRARRFLELAGRLGMRAEDTDTGKFAKERGDL